MNTPHPASALLGQYDRCQGDYLGDGNQKLLFSSGSQQLICGIYIHRSRASEDIHPAAHTTGPGCAQTLSTNLPARPRVTVSQLPLKRAAHNGWLIVVMTCRPCPCPERRRARVHPPPVPAVPHGGLRAAPSGTAFCPGVSIAYHSTFRMRPAAGVASPCGAQRTVHPPSVPGAAQGSALAPSHPRGRPKGPAACAAPCQAGSASLAPAALQQTRPSRAWRRACWAPARLLSELPACPAAGGGDGASGGCAHGCAPPGMSAPRRAQRTSRLGRRAITPVLATCRHAGCQGGLACSVPTRTA